MAPRAGGRRVCAYTQRPEMLPAWTKEHPGLMVSTGLGVLPSILVWT